MLPEATALRLTPTLKLRNDSPRPPVVLPEYSYGSTLASLAMPISSHSPGARLLLIPLLRGAAFETKAVVRARSMSASPKGPYPVTGTVGRLFGGEFRRPRLLHYHNFVYNSREVLRKKHRKYCGSAILSVGICGRVGVPQTLGLTRDGFRLYFGVCWLFAGVQNAVPVVIQSAITRNREPTARSTSRFRDSLRFTGNHRVDDAGQFADCDVAVRQRPLVKIALALCADRARRIVRAWLRFLSRVGIRCRLSSWVAPWG